MTPEQKAQFEQLFPKWKGYKRNLVWTFDGAETAIIEKLAYVLLGRTLNNCPSCKIEAMRQLENLYNG
jgi:hypothetical protein